MSKLEWWHLVSTYKNKDIIYIRQKKNTFSSKQWKTSRNERRDHVKWNKDEKHLLLFFSLWFISTLCDETSEETVKINICTIILGVKGRPLTLHCRYCISSRWTKPLHRKSGFNVRTAVYHRVLERWRWTTDTVSPLDGAVAVSLRIWAA